MDTALLSDALAGNTGGPTDPIDKVKPVVDNNVRKAWNEYSDWLEKKGLKGNPILDRGEKSYQVLEEYRKENPKTILTRDHITPIQEDFSKYRDYVMQNVEKGKGAYSPGTTKENFMKGLSVVDGIPGSRTSSYKFPEGYLSTFENGKKVKVENKGFATTTSDVYAAK